MPNNNISAPTIPLDSNEPLWEWHIPTDRLFFSIAALRQLKLDPVPVSMTEYYTLLPQDAATELVASREEAISGAGGSITQCAYLYNGLWLNEYLMVLTRDSNGRASRVMGRIEASPSKTPMGFRSGKDILFSAGLWLYDVQASRIWRDPVCDSILGFTSTIEYPIHAKDSLIAVHPSERAALRRHYRLFCDSPFLGDSITDIVRVRHANGEYAPILTRATALYRDEGGNARLILGIMANSEAQQAQTEAQSKNVRMFHALNSMGSGQWNWDTKKDSIYFSPRYMEMLGYTPEEEAEFAKNWRDRIHPDDRDKIAKVHEDAITSPAHGDTYECTYRMERGDGGWAWLFDQGCVTWRDESGRAGHIIGSITNITTAQAERDRLEELFRHDALTGLRSRAFCKLEIDHIEHNSIRPVSVISIDITGLKMINDYLGHARGDELLIRSAHIMRRALRRSDCIGRMGGDEFIVLLPGCDRVKGEKVLSKLLDAFNGYNKRQPATPIFAAFGLASTDCHNVSLETVMAQADEKMYEHKKEQRKEAHSVLKELIMRETGREVGIDDRLTDN